MNPKIMKTKNDNSVNPSNFNLPVRLPNSYFNKENHAEQNGVYLWGARNAPPFMGAVSGWKIMGYGKAPWPKKDLPIAVMFERTMPPTYTYGGNSYGDEMAEGTRIWQHGGEEWVPGTAAYIIYIKNEN